MGKLIILILVFLPLRTDLFSQESARIEKVIELIKSEKLTEAKADLPLLEKKYPDHPGLLYIKGLLEPDGDRALKYFEEIVKNYPSSEYTPHALLKIGEYRYARGLYVGAEQILIRIPEDFPEYEHLESAIKLLLRSLLVAGKVDTAMIYLSDFRKRFSHIDYSEFTPSASGLDLKKEKPPEEEIKVSRFFSIQIGAFSSPENALKQKSIFEKRGYQVEIGEKIREGKKLHLVWIGRYETREKASTAGREIKNKFDQNYAIVQREE